MARCYASEPAIVGQRYAIRQLVSPAGVYVRCSPGCPLADPILLVFASFNTLPLTYNQIWMRCLPHPINIEESTGNERLV
jgi:hypothetical protein